MPRGLGVFSRIGKHIERCLQTISMTQSYYEPIQYDLDGKEDLLYWRKLLLSLGYEFYQKVIVTSLIIAKSYNTYYLIRILHSVIYT
jgi:uncharacterized alpha-E superfamily protein